MTSPRQIPNIVYLPTCTVYLRSTTPHPGFQSQMQVYRCYRDSLLKNGIHNPIVVTIASWVGGWYTQHIPYTLGRLTAGTYSHHPFFVRKMIWTKPPEDMFQPLIFQGENCPNCCGESTKSHRHASEFGLPEDHLNMCYIHRIPQAHLIKKTDLLRSTLTSKNNVPNLTWNLFVLYFGGWTLQNKVFSNQNKVFSNQNKGHLGSR